MAFVSFFSWDDTFLLIFSYSDFISCTSFIYLPFLDISSSILASFCLPWFIISSDFIFASFCAFCLILFIMFSLLFISFSNLFNSFVFSSIYFLKFLSSFINLNISIPLNKSLHYNYNDFWWKIKASHSTSFYFWLNFNLLS